MTPSGTLLLTKQEVAALLNLDDCIAAVEQAFKLQGEGKTEPPGILGMHAHRGGFHVKAGMLELERPFFAAKMNANFPENRQRNGLPTIQGVIVFCDGENGYPLAVMDSSEITTIRTGAATAVAAKHLARENSRTATICGCGIQGRIQLESLTRVRPIKQAYVYDIDSDQARRFADGASKDLEINALAVSDLAEAVSKSDICVTCTPSRQYFLIKDIVAAGTYVAGVGADNPEKHELEPALMASSTVVVDVLEQCATIGDLHHALEAGVVVRADVHAELSEIVAGKKPGRTADEEITIFDSTGMALQDAAAAAVVYEKARNTGCGVRLNLAG
jgi:alanine dehydrogenase